MQYLSRVATTCEILIALAFVGVVAKVALRGHQCHSINAVFDDLLLSFADLLTDLQDFSFLPTVQRPVLAACVRSSSNSPT